MFGIHIAGGGFKILEKDIQKYIWIKEKCFQERIGNRKGTKGSRQTTWKSKSNPKSKFNKEAKADSKAKANQKDYKAQNIKRMLEGISTSNIINKPRRTRSKSDLTSCYTKIGFMFT